MEDVSKVLEDLNKAAQTGALATARREELERYAGALCRSRAYTFFAERQFLQICETVRLHLLRSYIDSAEQRASRYQWLVIALAAASLISSLIQILAMAK
jgi:hypothetical protein